MDRRAFLAGTGAVLLAAPLAAEGQPAGKVYTVGLLSIGTDPARPVQWQHFLDAMRELATSRGRTLRSNTPLGTAGPTGLLLSRPSSRPRLMSSSRPEVGKHRRYDRRRPRSLSS